MEILIIGTGLLGAKLGEIGNQYYSLLGTYNQNIPNVNFSTEKLDITNKASVFKIINKFSPNWVIQTSAMTNVDLCETYKEKAFNINVIGTENVALACKETSAKHIYISSDYVFDGSSGHYKETDHTNPISYYGKTKLLGEEKIIEILSDFIICRASVIYGGNKKNFVTWVIDSLISGSKINIVTDQFVSPTLNTDLTEQIFSLIKRDEKGIFHTAGAERISRYDFTIKIAEKFGLDKRLINPITSDELNWVARRPMDSSLDITKISKIRKPLNVDESLNLLKKEMGL